MSSSSLTIDTDSLRQHVVRMILQHLMSSRKIKVHPVKLAIEYESLNLPISDFFEISKLFNTCDFIDELTEAHNLTSDQVKTYITKNFPEELTWDFVPFPGYRKLDAYNSCLGLLQEYGYTKEDFTYVIDNTSSSKSGDLTLQQFTETVYRLKTQKYNSCDESLIDIKCTFENGTVDMRVSYSF